MHIFFKKKPLLFLTGEILLNRNFGLYPLISHNMNPIHVQITNNGSVAVIRSFIEVLYLNVHILVNMQQGWTLRIVRLPATTESTCRTTELPTPLVRQDK